MALNSAPFSFYVGLAGIAFTFLAVATACKNRDRRSFHALLRFGIGLAVSIALGLLVPGLLVVFHRISPDSSLVSGGAAFTILAIAWSMREAKRDMAMFCIQADTAQRGEDMRKNDILPIAEFKTFGRRRIV